MLACQVVFQYFIAAVDVSATAGAMPAMLYTSSFFWHHITSCIIAAMPYIMPYASFLKMQKAPRPALSLPPKYASFSQDYWYYSEDIRGHWEFLLPRRVSS